MKYDIFRFKLPNKQIIPLKYFFDVPLGKKFVARSPSIPLGKIKIDDLFFNFSYKQQVAIMHHELWHYHNNLKHEFELIKSKPSLLFYQIPIWHSQEFNADLNARRMTSKKIMLSVLLKLKTFIDKGIIQKSHENTHPKIEDRISKIKNS